MLGRVRDDAEIGGAFAQDLGKLPGGTVFPSAANYLLLRLATPVAARVAARLEQQRLLVRECGNFVGLDERFLRVAVKSVEENSLLERALEVALKEA